MLSLFVISFWFEPLKLLSFAANVFESYSSFIISALIILLLVIIFVYANANIKLRRSRESLKENEERFRQLSNLTFEGIVIHKEGKVLDCNQAFIEMFGYSREELERENIVTLLAHPEDVKIIQNNVQTHYTKPYEIRGFKKTGEEIPVEIESREIKFNGEDVRVAALRDISERIKQEELIEKEQWLFQVLMNNIPDSIYFKDLDSNFIRVNRNTAKKFDIKNTEELIGKSDFDFFDDTHAKPAYKDEQHIILTKEPIIGKVEKETYKDGSVKWVSTTKLPLIDKNGEVQGTFGISRDITALKEAEETARKEKEKFELLFRLVPSAVFTVDNEKCITSWNNMAEKLTGFTSEEIIGQKCVVCAQEPCKYLCGLFDKGTSKPVIDAECTMKRKDGELITVSKNIDLITDEEGNVIGGVESFIDISERKRFEAKIQKINEELEETNKSKDRFFSIIAHDLRNPFVTLLGFTEMLVEDYNDFTDEEKIGYLKEMQNTSKTSYELLENLLQWSRSQTGRIKYEPEKMNFNNLLQKNFSLVEKSAELKNILLKSNIDEDIFVIADDDMITTVLRNLIINALKFTPKNGSITVSAEEKENFYQISVSDTGIGIAKDRAEKIFKIDEASSTEGTEGEKGSGLGLILSKEFIEKHGGEIWVESESNKGATFYFTLPKA